MNIFIETHQNLLICLIKHKVNFILIGGYAVIYHGYKRSTGDMDLWIEPNNENKLKLLCLSQLSFCNKEKLYNPE